MIFRRTPPPGYHPPTSRTTVAAQRPGRSWAAGLSSSLLHALLLLVLLAWWQPLPRGNLSAPDRGVGIAVAHTLNDRQAFALVDADSSSHAIDQAQAAAAAAAQLLADQPAESPLAQLDRLLSELAGSAPAPGGADAIREQSGGLGDLPPAAGGGGPAAVTATETELFGIRATGSTFVYVFDRSGSMAAEGGRPMVAARRELIGSLQSLRDVNQFQILFYNESLLGFRGSHTGRSGLLFADDPTRRAAIDFVRGVQADGGTDHLLALSRGLSFGAEVVFFLTDADDPLSQFELDRLVRRIVDSGATLHSIEFGTGPRRPSQGWIESLARRCGGQYRYIDILQLGKDDG
jgi:hypothetical protein